MFQQAAKPLIALKSQLLLIGFVFLSSIIRLLNQQLVLFRW